MLVCSCICEYTLCCILYMCAFICCVYIHILPCTNICSYSDMYFYKIAIKGYTKIGKYQHLRRGTGGRIRGQADLLLTIYSFVLINFYSTCKMGKLKKKKSTQWLFFCLMSVSLKVCPAHYSTPEKESHQSGWESNRTDHQRLPRDVDSWVFKDK